MKKHAAPYHFTCQLIKPLQEDDSEEILRDGLSLTHQIGPWFVQQDDLFMEIVKRFWRLMDHHEEEVSIQSDAVSNVAVIHVRKVFFWFIPLLLTSLKPWLSYKPKQDY